MTLGIDEAGRGVFSRFASLSSHFRPHSHQIKSFCHIGGIN
ncbi:hypothetical protein HMPREF1420_00989 [Helicobacter pylori GAM264Ai]|nr:hypothetical protein HMPREF1403_01159 [Helicobacter pylori GAM201Ai]EMH24356.1 hypothetical protein HMPREF1420_00989 [Helicobacter pylori GAM264Ai]